MTPAECGLLYVLFLLVCVALAGLGDHDERFR
jgi:hypothetical protein